jgi:ribonuclease HII
MGQLPTLDAESILWEEGKLRVAGVDEAGLGCLAGPVVAAAVVLFPCCPMIDGVKDSKLLSFVQRERLYTQIFEHAIAVGVGIATVREVEKYNVLQASYLAMQRSLSRVAPYDHALIDGREIKHAAFGAHTTIIKGDSTSYAIACASIVAKVKRDRLMRRLAQHYPGYGWEKNVGYGTKQHTQAIRELGVTPHHRRTYAPVIQAISPS